VRLLHCYLIQNTASVTSIRKVAKRADRPP